MLSAKNITKSYDDNVILNNVTINLREGEKMGLIGANGSGKTTLLQILAGQLKADSGETHTTDDSVLYLPQTFRFGEHTIASYMKSRQTDHDAEYMIPTELAVFDLDAVSQDVQCTQLSGGQQTRLYLAGEFLHNPEPSTLIMDEPTNNLDIEGIDWLISFLQSFKGTVIFTSHDRYLLDVCADSIAELENGVVKVYGGNYSFYKEQKEIELHAHQRQYTTQQKKIEKIQQDIQEYKNKALWGEHKFSSRQPYQKKKAAKAARTGVVRQKKLKRLLESTEYVSKPELRQNYGISLGAKVPTGKLVLGVENAGLTLGNQSIFSGVTFEVRGHNRVWLIGNNGSGKSMLLKSIIGEHQLTTGTVRLGSDVSYAYFAQDPIVEEHQTGIEYLSLSGASLTSCYLIASQLYLSEHLLQYRVSKLSRGQQAKLVLAGIILRKPDLLILDEPTNHLEIQVREELETALEEYQGAIVVASHDRYFIEKLTINSTVQMS